MATYRRPARPSADRKLPNRSPACALGGSHPCCLPCRPLARSRAPHPPPRAALRSVPVRDRPELARSNPAKTPSICTIIRPAGVPVSKARLASGTSRHLGPVPPGSWAGPRTDPPFFLSLERGRLMLVRRDPGVRRHSHGFDFRRSGRRVSPFRGHRYRSATEKQRTPAAPATVDTQLPRP